jgi:hypothetical protein
MRPAFVKLSRKVLAAKAPNASGAGSIVLVRLVMAAVLFLRRWLDRREGGGYW